jgi:hypothetical protein
MENTSCHLQRALRGVSISAPGGGVEMPPGTSLIVEPCSNDDKRFATVLWAGRRILVFDADLNACIEGSASQTEQKFF